MRILTLLALTATPALAHPPTIEKVERGIGWFDVTLSHDDTGWDHYADGWRVELADGTVISTRELAHPHVNEQPFTRRGLADIPIEGNKGVFIRASCNTTGWAEDRIALDDALNYERSD